MHVVTPQTAEKGGASEHRPGGIAFTYLLQGQEGQPDNYSLMLVHVADAFSTPRHRHNFDQVRVLLSGNFGFGPGQSQGPGSVGYFCEGTAYTQDAQGASTTLLLQSGGASGHGYMSHQQLQQAVAALKQRGSFEAGVFSWLDSDGKRHNQDGYEAAWQHCFGRTITYPKPRYDAPVILHPSRFGWVPDPEQPGVHTQHLGTFSERGLSLRHWRLQGGQVAQLKAGGQRLLAYVHLGAGASAYQPLQAKQSDHPQQNSHQSNPSVALQDGCAFALQRGEVATLRAGPQPLEILLFALPVFD